jgi:hypothetical protein
MAGSNTSAGPTLELVRESKIADLLPGEGIGRWEASGVQARGQYLYVIFDNLPHIARFHGSLRAGHRHNILVRQRGEAADFEDITYHPGDRRFLIINEARSHPENGFRPAIEEYDEDLRYLDRATVDFPLESENKGMEGVVHVRRGADDYILGLCEGNRCRGGAKGRKPGGGRIQIFQKADGGWRHRGTIKLPKSVQFEDYAAVDVAGNRIAVVSQASSALWIGTFEDDSWSFVDDGTVYPFPPDDNGDRAYFNIEGVAWLAADKIAAVSDKRKKGDQPKAAKIKDQSIHIFRIPG